MAIVKNTTVNFFISLLIFSLTFGLFFSSWPQILKEPSELFQAQEVQAESGDVFLFWDGDTDAPGGWSCVSCTGGDTYYQKFPLATSTPGGTGGNTTHDHNITFVSDGGPGASTGYDDRSPVTNVPTVSHNHNGSLTATSMTAALAVPAYYEMKIIVASSPSTIPAGAIAIFDTTSLTGDWELYTDADGLIIRGGPSASTSEASNHTHSGIGFTTAVGVGGGTLSGDANKTGEAVSHYHTAVGGVSNVGDSLPPYIDVVLAKALTEISFTDGMIAMFDNSSLPENWAEVAAINDNYFLRGNSTGYGGTGGSATHSHSDKAIATQGTADPQTDCDVAPSSVGAAINHTHNITVAFSSVIPNIPPYVGIIFAKYTAAAVSVSCTTPLSSTDFGTIDNTAVFTSSLDATTTVTTDSPTGFLMTVYDEGDAADPGLYKSVATADLIDSPWATNTDATGTLEAGQEGFGLQATTSSPDINIDIRFWHASGTSNTVGGLEVGAGSAVEIASSTGVVTDQIIFVTHKAAAAVVNRAGSYTDDITYSCTVVP